MASGFLSLSMAALASIERDDPLSFRDQLELTEIPAPPFK
jgi:hypothetical protein